MERLGDSHGLIAFDLDRFKQINDEFGHLAGDDVLKAVVRAARSAIRTDEEVYRFGGEEFLILVRAHDEHGLRTVTERLRAAIEALAIPHPANTPHGVVTASFGATLILAADLGTSDDEWLARADVALFGAKDAGRNQVVIAA